MQTITPELEAILKSKFQAGASGFRGRFVTGGVLYYPTTISVDHSLQTPASAFTVTFTNEEGEVGLAADTFVDNAKVEIWQWFGDEDNAVQTFEGFIDKISEHRDSRTVTVTGRDWCKPLLVQDIATTAPQGADEDGAVRTTANFVYLNMEISAIVTDLLDKAGYPAAQRAIQPSNFVVDEYLARDGSAYMDAIGELADIIAFNAFANEVGVFCFQPDGLADATTDDPPVPVYTFETGVDITALDPTRDDYDLKTRVKAVGPYTTAKDAWTELWHTNVIKDPTGIMYDPADPTNIYVADGFTKKKYKVNQTTRAIVAQTGVLVTTFLNGLSGDPDDATVYWTLDAPWIVTGVATNNKVRKHLKSNDSVLATYNLPNKQWSDLKVGVEGIYVASYAEDKIYLYDKTDGSAITSWNVLDGPVGIAVDDSEGKLYQLYTTAAKIYISSPTALDNVTDTIVMSGTRGYGADIDTTTHTEAYVVLGGISLVAKMTLIEPVTTDVSVEVVNDTLEAQLGVELDTGVEIRRLVLRLDEVTSYAQATEAAARWLDRIDQFRNVLDVGVIGNPAIQKGDMVRVEDPVTEIANDFQVDTYRTSMASDGTYLGTMALVPWISSYAGPGDIFPIISSGFPTIASEASGSGNSGVYTATLPSGIVSGNLILGLLAANGHPAITWPAGWTEIAQYVSFEGGLSATVGVGYREADGSEGSTISLSGPSNRMVWRFFRITGAKPATAPFVSASAHGDSMAPNSSAATDPGGAENVLWFSAAAVDWHSGVFFPGSYPSGWENGSKVQLVGGIGAGATATLLSATLNELIDVEDPPAFAIGGDSEQWVAVTVGVRPA